MRWAIFLILFFLVLMAFVPVTKHSVLVINANFSNVYQSLNNPQNWVKWQPDLKDHAGNTAFKNESANAQFEITGKGIKFKVKKNGLTDFDILKTRTRLDKSEYNYILIADSSTLKTDVFVIQKTNVLGYLKSFVAGDPYQGTPVNDLKVYMEDPRLYYGYEITEQIAHEKILIIKRRTILKDLVYKNNQAFLKSLDSIAKKNGVVVTDAMQLQYISAVGDSVTMIMGLPVNKKISTKGDAENMGMPGGKVLVGHFKGKYSDRKKLYRAMQLYLADHFMHTQTLPLEKFTHNKLPVNDDDKVDMQLVVPYL